MGYDKTALMRHDNRRCMDHKPRPRGIWRLARRMIALAAVVALFTAPVIVILSHGPAAHAAAAGMVAEIAAHGHAHSKSGGDADSDLTGGPLGGHDATDHEHQLQSLADQPGQAERPAASGAPRPAITAFQGLARDGPKRPPRTV